MSRLEAIGHPDRALLSRPYLAAGCRLCFPGLKAVVFVTGMCDDGCYYCPVSRDRLGSDVMYVNEEPVSSVDEIVLEVARSGARGASITGGDPLTVPGRTLEVIRALKESFGPGFHIHLYTSGRYATARLLRELDRAGLDEIRFHPTVPRLVEKVGLARRITSMSVGVEIPVGPGLVGWAKKIILEADRLGAEFVNLNELEFVEPNARALLARGLRESKKRPFTVEGALEVAIEIVTWARRNVRVPVHFCPASFKDSIQTRNRLRRLAELDARWCEKPTSYGTIVWASSGSECVHPSMARPGQSLVEAYPTRSRRPVIATRTA